MIYELEKLAGSFNKVASSEHLQVLAKRAASSFIKKEEDSLTESIKSIIEDEGLNKNQIQRVSEMANQAVWKAQFHENGDSNNFDPADASALLNELDSKPALQESPNLDYGNDPGEMKEEYDLDEIFKSEGSEDYPQLNPNRDIQVGQEKAASVKNMAEYSLNTIMRSMEDTVEEFYGFVKQAHLGDGIGILQIAKALSETTNSEKFAASIVKTASDRLQSEGVRLNLSKEKELLDLPVVVNSDHPLLYSAVRLEKLAKSYTEAYTMYEKAQEQEEEYIKKIKSSLL